MLLYFKGYHTPFVYALRSLITDPFRFSSIIENRGIEVTGRKFSRILLDGEREALSFAMTRETRSSIRLGSLRQNEAYRVIN